MKKSSTTQYVLVPKSIFDRFFKDIKLNRRKISGVIDEAAIKESSGEKRKADKPTKESKAKRTKRESTSSSEFTDTESDDSGQS